MTNKGSLDMKLVMKQCCIICPHSNCITLSVLSVYMLTFRINLCDFVYLSMPQNLGWNGSLDPLRPIFYYHSCNVIFFFAIPLKKLFKIINGFNLPIFIARSSVAVCMNLCMKKCILNLDTDSLKSRTVLIGSTL